MTLPATGIDHTSLSFKTTTRVAALAIVLLFSLPSMAAQAPVSDPATTTIPADIPEGKSSDRSATSLTDDTSRSAAPQTPDTAAATAEQAAHSKQPALPEKGSLDQPRENPEQIISAADLLAGYQQQINAQLALNGAYDPGLSESLAGMGRLLQLHGDHDSAILAYQQAMHIQRVNNGIYSLSQEPMLRAMISSYQAKNELDSAGQHFEQLHWLYTKTYGESDPRLIPLAAEISAWHLYAYNQNPTRQGLYHLITSHKLVARAIDLMTHESDNGTLTVLPLLRNLVITNFHLADHQRRYPVGTREGFSFRANNGNPMEEPLSQEEILMINSYTNGRRAHERIITTLFNNPEASAVDKARSVSDLGDWYLLFGRTESAGKAYSQAWQVSEADPVARQELETLFRDPQLMTPQSMGLAPQAARATDKADSEFNIVARLTISARGEVRAAEILETYPEDNEAIAEKAVKNLKKLRFRPRIVSGQMVASDDFTFKLSMLE